MKKILFLSMLLAATTLTAKDLKTVVLTTQPQMHCSGCENKIKNNLRFLKGIKQIDTSVEKQHITVTYDADKTTVQKLIESLKKAGYTAREVKPAKK